jgi:MFS family permease
VQDIIRIPRRIVPPGGTGGKVAPVGRGFMALYAIAQIGAFIAFLPLLQILLPLRAAAIDPPNTTQLLSHIGLAGAVVASLANLAFGTLSDRTHAARGRRRPWILGGLAATLASYALVWHAATPGALLLGIIAFQLAFNAMFAALGAVLADNVPEQQRGLMSALLGLGYPLGSLAGLAAVGAWPMQDGAGYAAVGVLVTLCVLPFAWRLRAASPAEGGIDPNPDKPGPHKQGHDKRGPGIAGRHAAAPAPFIAAPQAGAPRGVFAQLGVDFLLVWASRMFIVTTLGIVQGYMLLYLRTRGAAPLQARPEAVMAEMTAIATVCNIGCAVLSGVLSDRLGHRKPFVVAGGVMLAAGMVCAALVPGWAGLRAAAVLYGGGNGLYSTVDLALMVQILPSIRRAGQYLGIMNLANTVAQVAAPLLALQVLVGAAPDYRALFLMAAAASLLGAACILGVTGRR